MTRKLEEIDYSPDKDKDGNVIVLAPGDTIPGYVVRFVAYRGGVWSELNKAIVMHDIAPKMLLAVRKDIDNNKFRHCTAPLIIEEPMNTFIALSYGLEKIQ